MLSIISIYEKPRCSAEQDLERDGSEQLKLHTSNHSIERRNLLHAGSSRGRRPPTAETLAGTARNTTSLPEKHRIVKQIINFDCMLVSCFWREWKMFMWYNLTWPLILAQPSAPHLTTHPHIHACKFAYIPERLSECFFHILVEWFLEIVAKHPEGSTALTLADCSIHMSLRRQVISSAICGSVDTSMGSQLGCGGSKLIGCCCLLGSLWDWLRGSNGTN